MMWHDNSSITAHSHLLIMISYLYDPACYLVDSEFKKRHGVNINVQCVVEKPEIYILAGCPLSNQQMLYSEEIYENLIELKAHVKVNGDLNINDKLRVFKGDEPAAQFEVGQEKMETITVFHVEYMLKLVVVTFIVTN